jgi:hypothetical protein
MGGLLTMVHNKRKTSRRRDDVIILMIHVPALRSGAHQGEKIGVALIFII